MRIGVNCRELLSHRVEGICRYIRETTRRLVLDHPEDEFVFFFDRPYDSEFIFADNITPVVIGPQARHPILWHLWFEYSLPKAMEKHNVDVFYSGDTFLSMKTDVPTLLVCHDVAYVHYPDHIRKSHLRYYRRNFPKFHSKAAHIVAVSEFTRNDIIKQYKLSPEKVSVGYNATPPGFRRLTSSEKKVQRDLHSEGNPYFIFVGSLHPRKNLVKLILAFDKFKTVTTNDYKLVLVGRFAWKNKELQETFKKIKHKSDIIFKGHVQAGIQEIIGGSEGLFYLSLFEGFGIPILEGFSSYVPVVTSNVSSMPEVAADCGTVIDPTDIMKISETMQQLAKHDTDEQMLQKAAVRAESFTWKKTADLIYEKLLQIR